MELTPEERKRMDAAISVVQDIGNELGPRAMGMGMPPMHNLRQMLTAGDLRQGAQMTCRELDKMESWSAKLSRALSTIREIATRHT